VWWWRAVLPSLPWAAACFSFFLAQGTHLGSRGEGDNRVIKLEGTPGLDTNATWEAEIPEQNKITGHTADAVT